MHSVLYLHAENSLTKVRARFGHSHKTGWASSGGQDEDGTNDCISGAGEPPSTESQPSFGT